MRDDTMGGDGNGPPLWSRPLLPLLPYRIEVLSLFKFRRVHNYSW